MTLFEDYLQVELPKRSALETNVSVSYDGDPNDGGAPAALKAAPLGTWFRENTVAKWWRKIGGGDTDWESQSGAQGAVTEEALTFPVDYNDGTAVDPPAAARFSTQAAIDDFLADNSTSNFKHFMAAWDSAPAVCLHSLIFNLAAGVHRARAGDSSKTAAFYLTAKSIFANIVIQGASGPNYGVVVASATITATSAGVDPYADFTGTPFAGVDLRGLYAVFDTGQVTVISDHTSSRLYVMDVITGSPAVAFVGTPSTILRNSLDDSTKVHSNTGFSVSLQYDGSTNTLIILNDLRIDGFGVSRDVSWFSGYGFLSRFSVDHATVKNDFAVVGTNSRCFQLWAGGRIATFAGFSLRGTGVASTPSTNTLDCLFMIGLAVVGSKFYFGGASNAALYASTSTHRTFLAIKQFVLDDCAVGIKAIGDALVLLQETGTGKRALIRNMSSIGMEMLSSELFEDATGQKLRFEDIAGPCVKVLANARLSASIADVELSTGPAGGNADVGIEVEGPSAFVYLRAGATVTGSVGEVRMQTTLLTYADIVANGPYIDTDHNFLKKV